ncbi:hypothetical protein DH2020_006477 [Rehmannia glutinosa]|uniref:Trichome birefringence-like N-terminal domain-containing protein n=1 Tax=Rehmannia glutinosa TaxID=99300 RepID=A0ABR0XJK3_REHGL
MAKKLAASDSSLASRLLLSLLCLVSLLLCFSLFRIDTASPSLTYSVLPEQSNSNCNYSNGRWIYDHTVRYPPRYDHNCKEIFKGWNCIASNKSNAIDIIKWRWKPYGCDLPPFDALRFLENFRDTNIGFVGDSLNRNMFVSLFCALKQVSPEVKKWRPVGADRGFTFLKHNLTIAYHRTNLLARYGRIDVDMPDGTWAEAPSFHDILVFNTGHWWWAPSKFDPVNSPMLFFEKGVPVTPPVPPDAGLDMVSFVEKNVRSSAMLFFQHNPQGILKEVTGTKVEELFSLKNNGTNVETRLVNEHLHRALKGTTFQIMDITHMSEFRADAHPSTAGGKRHDDCMHWCLPGLTDTWNDLFIAHLNSLKARN